MMKLNLARTARAVLYILTAGGFLFGAWGCSGPKARWGYTPNGTFGNPEKLGSHSYAFGGSEAVGIFYTLRGGSLDMDHIRGAADLSRATYIKAYKTILQTQDQFTVSPALEMTTNTILVEYPSNWDSLPPAERERVAREAALIIGPVVGYYSTLWHEMLTWKGTHFILIEPEHTSAFSWDDLYSNALGTHLGYVALQKTHLDEAGYNATMTLLISEEFKRLGIVSREEAQRITRSVEGTWYGSGKLMKRNMDAGFDDGMITPSIIPGFTKEQPIPVAVPTLEGLDQYGIKIKYTIHSVYFENNALKKMAGVEGDVQPIRDFPIIMPQIEQEAIVEYGYQVR